MDEKDIFAASLVAFIALAVSLSTFDAEHLFTLESYSHALNVERTVKGEESAATYQLYYSLAAFIYSQMADLAGAHEFSPSLLIASLKFLSAFLAALTAAAAYMAFRGLFPSAPSAFGSVMLITSISAASVFLSGFISPASMGLASFMCGLALFIHGWKRTDMRLSVAGGILLAFSTVAWNDALALAALGAGIIGAILFDEYSGKRNGAFLYSGILAIALGAIGWALTGFAVPNTLADPVTELSLLLLFAPLASAALLITALKALGKAESCEPDAFALVFGIASIAAGLYSPVGALPGLAFLSAFTLDQLPSAMKERWLALLIAGCAGGFAAFVFLLSLFPPQTSALFGGLIAIGVAFAAASYKGERLPEYTAYSLAVALAFASISSALLLAQSQLQAEPFKGEAAAAIDWIVGNTPPDAVVGVVGQDDAYAFLLQRKVVSRGVADWLLSTGGNASGLSAVGVNYLLLDSSAFDRLEQLKNETNKSNVRIDSFRFIGYRTDNEGAVYGLFVSQNGNAAYIPFTEGIGFDPSSYAIIVDPSGNARHVPFARFVMLKDAEGRIVRAIYPYENYDVNLFNTFFGNVDGLIKVYPGSEGTVRIYKVSE